MENGSKLYIEDDVFFDYYEWSGVSLNYVEHSKDYWYSSEDKSFDFSKEDAIKIIAFLKEAYDL